MAMKKPPSEKYPELARDVEQRRVKLGLSKAAVGRAIGRSDATIVTLIRHHTAGAETRELLEEWLHETANGTAPEASSETQSVLRKAEDSSEPATAEETRDCLLLVGDNEIPDIEEIEGWTQEQRDAAAAWACAVHCQASDNDDVVVPPLPEELRERLRDLGAWSSVPAPAPTVEPCPSCDCPRGASSVCEHCGDGGTVPEATEFEIVEPEPGTVPPDEWEGPREESEEVRYRGAHGRFSAREVGGIWQIELTLETACVDQVAELARIAARNVFAEGRPAS